MERGLGALKNKQLNMSEQCVSSAKKPNGMLGCINRGITRRDKEAIIPVYSVLARALLE